MKRKWDICKNNKIRVINKYKWTINGHRNEWQGTQSLEGKHY